MRKLKIKYALALSLAGVCALGTTSGLKATSRGVAPKEKFTYVSFGASQAAGMGLHGFLEEHFYDEPEKLYPTKNALERDGYYSSGYIKYSEQSYPSLIKDELAKSYDNVNFHQCAINSMRAYDLAYMLDSSFPKDKYIDWRLGDETNGWIHDINRARDESLTFLNGDVVNFKKDETNIREEFRSYVASADLISYDLGSNDFLIYVGNMITERLKNPQKFKYSNDLHPLIGEDADKFLELKGMVEDFILPTLGDTLDSTILNLLDFLADTLAYACVGFIKGFDTAMKVIYDLNPDVEVVVLGIQNMAQDLKITLEGKTINLGEYLGYIIKAANIYTSYLSPFSDRYYYTEMGGNGRAILFYDEIKAWDGNPSSISPLIKEAFNVYEQELLVKTEIRKFINKNAGEIIEVYNYVAPVKVTTPEAAAPVLAALQERIAEYVYYYIMDATNIAFQDMMVDPLNVDEGALNFIFELAQAPEALQTIVMNLVQGNDDSNVYAAVHAQIVELLKDPKIHSTVAMVMLTSYGNSVFAHPNVEGHKEMAKVVMDAYNAKKVVKYDLAQVYVLLEELTGLPVQRIVETLMAKKEEAVVLFENTGELVSLYSGEILDVIKEAIGKVAPVVVEEAKGLADFSFARLSELKDSVMAKLAEGVDLAKVKVNEAVEEIKEVIAKEVAGLKAILELTVKAMEITLKAQAKKAIEFGEAKLAETYNAVLVKLVEIKDNLVETSQAIGEAAVRALKAAGEDIKEYLIGLLHSSEYEALKSKLMSDIKGEFDAFVLEAKKLGEELFVKFNNAATEFGEFVKDSVKLIAQNTVEGIKAVGNEVLSMHINLVNIAKAVEAFVSGAEAYLINLYNGGLEQVHTTVNEILEAVQGGITYCYDKVNGAVELAQSVKDMVEEYVKKITEAAKAKYENALEKSKLLRSIVEEFVEKVQTLFGKAELTIAEINAAIEAIKSQISSMADEAALEAHKVIDSLIVARDAIKEAMEKAKEVVVKVEQSLEEATKLIQEAVSKVAAAAEKAMVLAEEAAAKLVAVFNEVKGAVIAVAIATSAAITTVITVINAVNAEIAEKLPGVAAVLNSVVNGIVSFAEATCEFLVDTTRKIAKVTGEVIEVAEKAIKAFYELKAMIGEAIDTTKAMIEYISIEAEKIMVKVQEVMEVVKHIYNVIDETFPGFLDKVNEVVSTAVQKEIEVNVKFLNEQINKLGDETVEKIKAELVVIDGKFVALEERLEEIVANALVEALEVITDGAVKASIEAKETAGEIVYLVVVASVESVVDVNVAVIEGIVDVFNTIIDELTTAPEINFVMNQADVVAAKEGLNETVESSIEEIVQADKNAQNNMADALYRLLQSLNLAD